MNPKKLILKSFLSPGDIVMMTAMLRDLHTSYPGEYLTDVRTPCPALWENNPFITLLDESDPDVTPMRVDYPLINDCNDGSHHFIHGYTYDLASKLKRPIRTGPFKGDIYVSDDEKGWFSQVYEVLGKDVPYWIINAGHKSDYTAKMWAFDRYQKVVEAFPNIYFVQVGADEKDHTHARLKGDNVVDMVGKSDLRQLVRMIYHSAGVISGVSLPMHLAAAVEMKPAFKRSKRPCIVIAGGREPSVWEAYTVHQYIHTCGMLSCCDDGGCWKSRIVPIGDNDRKDGDLCKKPVTTSSGQVIPKCMDMISADRVIEAVKMFLEDYSFYQDLKLNDQQCFA